MVSIFYLNKFGLSVRIAKKAYNLGFGILDFLSDENREKLSNQVGISNTKKFIQRWQNGLKIGMIK